MSTHRSPEAATIVWFRNDLRLDDNPALDAAVGLGKPVVPVYVWAPQEEGDWAPGGAARVWLHRSLVSLDDALRRRGSRLTVQRGDTRETLDAIAADIAAAAIVWNRRYEPAAVARDTAIKKHFQQRGLDARSFNGALLHEPWDVMTSQGTPYQVFTPFWNRIQALPEPAHCLRAPKDLVAPERWPRSMSIGDLGLAPAIDWAAGIRAAWSPGEEGGRRALADFLDGPIAAYSRDRDRPDRPGTSRLSPHLHFGEISARRIWNEARVRTVGQSRGEAGTAPYLRQLAWREFAHHVLFHFPRTPHSPLRADFRRFPWRRSRRDLEAWQRGQTGYPLVDAGMRHLWATGWMPNRVRMVAASFLVKHLLLSWIDGARWFWDTLVDADLANNTFGWQWVAGCGADAAPYFRVFNPSAQGSKFDPTGAYVRTWVPELAALPDRYLHEPWMAPPAVLERSGVDLGRSYPLPIVDHREARARALSAFERQRRARQP